MGWSHHVSMRAGLLTTSDFENQYKVVCKEDNKRDWHGARRACNAWGGELASVSNKRDRETVLELLDGKRAWIGGHDLTNEGKWEWTDGSDWKW